MMVFDMNGDDYLYLKNKDHSDAVDILIINHLYESELLPSEIIPRYNFQKSFFFDIKHNIEDQVKHLNTVSQDSLQDYTVTNAIDFSISNDRIIFYDFLFNRTKAYYTNQIWNKNIDNVWYYAGKSAYQTPNHNVENKFKLFVAPNNSRGGDRVYRKKLVDHLIKKHSQLGFVGDITTDPSLRLVPQNDTFPNTGYNPPHTSYYENTFISVYAETIEFGSSYAATEKTLDPLIKGHFILPFSNYGFVNFIKTTYGFQMPEFIDYSYDQISDNDIRYKMYIEELDRLMNIDISLWKTLWEENLHIIKHNQQIFYNNPYHKIDFSRYL